MTTSITLCTIVDYTSLVEYFFVLQWHFKKTGSFVRKLRKVGFVLENKSNHRSVVPNSAKFHRTVEIAWKWERSVVLAQSSVAHGKLLSPVITRGTGEMSVVVVKSRCLKLVFIVSW